MVYYSGELQLCPGCRLTPVPKVVGFCSVACQERIEQKIRKDTKEMIKRIQQRRKENGYEQV